MQAFFVLIFLVFVKSAITQQTYLNSYDLLDAFINGGLPEKARSEELLSRGTDYLSFHGLEKLIGGYGLTQKLIKKNGETITEVKLKQGIHERQLLELQDFVETSLNGMSKLIQDSVLPKLNKIENMLNFFQFVQNNIQNKLNIIPKIETIDKDNAARFNFLRDQLFHLNGTQSKSFSLLNDQIRDLAVSNISGFEYLAQLSGVMQRSIEENPTVCKTNQENENKLRFSIENGFKTLQKQLEDYKTSVEDWIYAIERNLIGSTEDEILHQKDKKEPCSLENQFYKYWKNVNNIK